MTRRARPRSQPKNEEDLGRFAALAAILLAGLALRAAWMTVDRFHADEALYAGWALAISHEDPWLVGAPVDKPPLYLYILAGAARLWGPGEFALRLPNLAASTLGIAAAYQFGKELYGRATGIWTALLVALSPFDILFARTAFTDPTLVLWTLLAMVAAARGRWFAAGACAGLAFATKQHALLLFPLVVAIGLVRSTRKSPSHPHGRSGPLRRASGKARSRVPPWTWRLGQALRGVLGFAIPFGLVVLWDSARWAVRPGFWAQSVLSYGGLAWAPPGEWVERLGEWLGWAWHLAPSPVLMPALLAGTALRFVRRPRGARQGEQLAAKAQRGAEGRPVTSWQRKRWIDAVLAVYAAGYLLAHVALGFSIWDRYLLPLVIPVSLLLARVAVCVPISLAQPGPPQGTTRAASASYDGGCECGTHTPAQPGSPDRGTSRAASASYDDDCECGTHTLARPALSQGTTRAASASYEGRTGGGSPDKSPVIPSGAQRNRGISWRIHQLPPRAAWAALLIVAALLPAWRACRNGYPIGGEHWAYQGIDRVAAYIRDHAPPDAVIYHHWLRWHHEYYMRGSGVELRWWAPGERLYPKAAASSQRAQYLIYPDWSDLRPDTEGLDLIPVFQAHRADGSVSLRVFRVEVQPLDESRAPSYNSQAATTSPYPAACT